MSDVKGTDPADVTVDEWITMQSRVVSLERQLRQSAEDATEAAQEWRVQMEQRDGEIRSWKV